MIDKNKYYPLINTQFDKIPSLKNEQYFYKIFNSNNY